jgi:hypothetical protein
MSRNRIYLSLSAIFVNIKFSVRKSTQKDNMTRFRYANELRKSREITAETACQHLPRYCCGVNKYHAKISYIYLFIKCFYEQKWIIGKLLVDMNFHVKYFGRIWGRAVEGRTAWWDTFRVECWMLDKMNVVWSCRKSSRSDILSHPTS